MNVLNNRPTKPFRFRPLGLMASIGHHNAVAEIRGLCISGFPAWFLWRGVYLAKMPTLLRKIEVAIDWAWSILFPPNIAQLKMARTERVGRAHYVAGEYVFRKGDAGDQFFVIERGQVGVYLESDAAPVATLGPGDHFGEGAALTPGGKGRRTASIKAETAVDLVTMGQDDFFRLTENLASLKKAVHRAIEARRSYAGFMDFLRDEPRLQHCAVADLMSAPAETLTPEMTLEQAVNRFHNGRPGYPVTDGDGLLVGYCGRAELYDGLRAAIADAEVRQFMRANPPFVTANQPLSDAVGLMLREQMEILPVLASDGTRQVAGVLSPIDIFRHTVIFARKPAKSHEAA